VIAFATLADHDLKALVTSDTQIFFGLGYGDVTKLLQDHDNNSSMLGHTLKMKSILLPIIALFVSIVYAEELLPLDAEIYSMKLNSEAVHPDGKLLPRKIPMSAYQPMQKKQVLTLQVRRDLTYLTIQPIFVSGRLKGGTSSNRVYTLFDPGGAKGRLEIERTKQGLVSTFTQYASDGSVLWSKRGPIEPLVPAREDGKKVDAETVTFSQIVEALDTTFICEYRKGKPFEGSVARHAAGGYIILRTFKAGVEQPTTGYCLDQATNIWGICDKDGVPIK